jgi:hypothetical protein
MPCRAEPKWAEVSRAEAGWLLRSSKQLWQRSLTTPVNTTSGYKAARETTVASQSVNTVTTQQGNEARVPLSDWGFIRESVIKSHRRECVTSSDKEWTVNAERKPGRVVRRFYVIVRDNWNVSKWRFIVCLQDLVSTVVQLYWECVIHRDLDNSRVINTWRLLGTEWIDLWVGLVKCVNP